MDHKRLRILVASAAATALVCLTYGAWAGDDHVAIASGTLHTADSVLHAQGTRFIVQPVDDDDQEAQDQEQQEIDQEQLQESMQAAEEQNEEAQQQATQDEVQAQESDPQVIQNAQQG